MLSEICMQKGKRIRQNETKRNETIEMPQFGEP